jgi:NAD(P) transhydrogenase
MSAHCLEIRKLGTLEYFRDTVFNYLTLAEAYKGAALDGLNKL